MKFKGLVKNLAYGGTFVGNITETEETELIGKTFFVPFAAPNEEIEGQIVANKKSFVDAELVSLNTKSNNRVEPLCQYFYTCGGCNLQHLDIDYQRQLKNDLLKNTFNKITGAPLAPDIIDLSLHLPSYFYRNRIKLHFRDKKIGFFRPKTRDLIEIDSCVISSKHLNQCLDRLNKIKEKIPTEIYEIAIEEYKDSEIITFIVNPNLEKIDSNLIEVIQKLLKEFKHFNIKQRNKFLFSSSDEIKNSNTFSQINNNGNLLIQNLVIEKINNSDVTELYAGNGNFTFKYYDKVKQIDAVELDHKLVKIALKTITDKNLKNIKFYSSSSENFVKKNKLKSTLLLDPPRDGAINALNQADFSLTKQIIYISCNMSTFSRDIKYLLDMGFKFKEVYTVDMFPQTSHLEIVGILSKD